MERNAGENQIRAGALTQGAAASGNEAYLTLLREDIQAAGRGTRLARLGVNVGLLGGMVAAAPALVEVLRHVAFVWYPGDIDMRYRVLAAGMVGGLFAANSLAGALLTGYRRLRREHFRRKLSHFTLEQQAEVLLPLEHEPLQETRELVYGILRELRARGTELVPAKPDATAPTPAGPGAAAPR